METENYRNKYDMKNTFVIIVIIVALRNLIMGTTFENHKT